MMDLAELEIECVGRYVAGRQRSFVFSFCRILKNKCAIERVACKVTDHGGKRVST